MQERSGQSSAQRGAGEWSRERAEEPHPGASFRGWGRQKSPGVKCSVSQWSMAPDNGPPSCKITSVVLSRKEGDGAAANIPLLGNNPRCPPGSQVWTSVRANKDPVCSFSSIPHFVFT